MNRLNNRGNTKTEYALIFGLVVIVSIASLGVLGGSVSDLLDKKVGGALSSESGGGGSASKLMGLIQTAPAQIDPISGLPITRYSYPGSSDTNATSVQNDKHNEVGSFMLGNAMKRLAEETEDPNLAAAFMLASDKMLLMGAAAGSTRGIPELVVPDIVIPGKAGKKGGIFGIGKKKATPPQVYSYTSKDAVNDISRHSAELKAIMDSIPPDMTNPDYVEAMALAQDSMKIGQKFVDNPVNHNAPASGRTYESTTDSATLNAKADVVLTNNKVDDVDVEVTLTDSKMTKKIAERKARKAAGGQ